MKVSIIIPVYHVEKYIERCVLSVLKQTYRPLEVVFVDDCSNDKSIYIAKKTIEKNGAASIEFVFLEHDKNQGLSAARNSGIKASTGNYLYFLDSDDEIADNAINIFVSQLKDYPKSEVVHGMMVLDNGDDYHCSLKGYRAKEYFENNADIRQKHFSLNPLFPDSACDKLIKRDFLINNKLFFKEGIIFEDTHWSNRVVKRINYLSFISQPTYIRYVNPNTIMTSLTKEREIKNIGIILKDFLSTIDEPCYNEQLFSFFSKFLIYNDASSGEYGFASLYKDFQKLFVKRGFMKMSLLMFLYKCRYFIVPENKVKARLRGYMHAEINSFFSKHNDRQ